MDKTFRGFALLLIVALAACAESYPSVDSPVEEAAIMAVLQDVLREVPSEAETLPRYMWDRFDAGTGEILPERVATIADLPVVSAAEVEDRTLPMLVLNLATPQVSSPDSVTIIVEWLVFEPGRQFWGVEYHYAVACPESCTFTRYGPGFLN